MDKRFMWIAVAAAVISGSLLALEEARVPAALPHSDAIRVTAPVANAIVTSPLAVSGDARGTWYFEASFPVELLDADRNRIAVVPAAAQGEWMTENFVPFRATLDFTPPATDTGFLVVKKDNPSGLPEHDAHVEIPVRFR